MPKTAPRARASTATRSAPAGCCRCLRSAGRRGGEAGAAPAPSVAFLVGLVLGGRLLHPLRQLAEQVVIEHRARDRRGGARAEAAVLDDHRQRDLRILERREGDEQRMVAQDRKSTRLNSSHMSISYAVFCLKKKKK